jgi:hypothetical protein
VDARAVAVGVLEYARRQIRGHAEAGGAVGAHGEERQLGGGRHPGQVAVRVGAVAQNAARNVGAVVVEIGAIGDAKSRLVHHVPDVQHASGEVGQDRRDHARVEAAVGHADDLAGAVEAQRPCDGLDLGQRTGDVVLGRHLRLDLGIEHAVELSELAQAVRRDPDHGSTADLAGHLSQIPQARDGRVGVELRVKRHEDAHRRLRTGVGAARHRRRDPRRFGQPRHPLQ